jgi:hypothetical protein
MEGFMNDYDRFRIANGCAKASLNKFIDFLKYLNIDLPYNKKVDIYAKIQDLLEKELEDIEKNESQRRQENNSIGEGA